MTIPQKEKRHIFSAITAGVRAEQPLSEFCNCAWKVHRREHRSHSVTFVLLAALYPTIEVAFLLEKTEVIQNKVINFKSSWGMPIKGEPGC